MASRKKSNKKNNLFVAIAVLVVIILVAVIVVLYLNGAFDPILKNIDSTFRGASEGVIDGTPIIVYFVNVGQGDAIVLDLPDDKCMLIDGGTTKSPPQGNAKDIHASYLQEVVKNGVIDYLIVTHSDSDHYSFLSSVLDSYEIKNIYFNDISDENSIAYTPTYKKFCDKIKSEEGATIVAVDTPDDNTYTFSVGDCDFTVFSPGNDGFTNQKARVKNGMSLLTLLEYGDRKILFAGDATDEEEEWFLDYTSTYDMDIDFLKIAHHGSATSNCAAFLAYVKAEYGVISVGEGNSYNLPAADTLTRIRDADITYYRTDYVGTIVLTVDSDGDFLFEFPDKEE